MQVSHKSQETLDELYPELSETERREALANLRHYFEVALAVLQDQISERGLTSPESLLTIKERSNEKLKT